MTEIRATGVYVVGECDLQLPGCKAVNAAPVTVVKAQPSGKQVNVCSACLQEMLNRQEWHLTGAGFSAKYDFVLQSDSGDPLVVLEVKRPPVADEHDELRWARSYVRNLAAHGRFRRSALLILSVLDGATYAFRLTESAPEAELIQSVDTSQAFHDLGLTGPPTGLDERFAES